MELTFLRISLPSLEQGNARGIFAPFLRPSKASVPEDKSEVGAISSSQSIATTNQVKYLSVGRGKLLMVCIL